VGREQFGDDTEADHRRFVAAEIQTDWVAMRSASRASMSIVRKVVDRLDHARQRPPVSASPQGSREMR